MSPQSHDSPHARKTLQPRQTPGFGDAESVGAFETLEPKEVGKSRIFVVQHAPSHGSEQAEAIDAGHRSAVGDPQVLRDGRRAQNLVQVGARGKGQRGEKPPFGSLPAVLRSPPDAHWRPSAGSRPLCLPMSNPIPPCIIATPLPSVYGWAMARIDPTAGTSNVHSGTNETVRANGKT